MAKSVRKKRVASGACAGNGKDGPCKARPMKGQRYCFFHDPRMEEERQKARRRGAAVKHGLEATPLAMKAPDGLRTIGELMELVEVILRGCIQGDVDHKLASAMGGLVRVQAGLLTDYQFEDRLKALEEATKGKTDGPRVA